MLKNFVVGLFASVLLHQVYSMIETAPVFMWSNSQTFTGRNLQEIDVISARVLSKFTQTESPISKYLVQKSEAQEVIIVFVEPFLSSEQIPLLSHAYDERPNGGAFSNLKKLVETSKSSLVIPYTSSASVGSEFIRSLTASLPNGGSVYTVGDNTNSNVDSVQLTVAELLEKLGNSNWTPLNNGVTDLIVVHFNAPTASNYDDSSVRTQYENDDHSIGAITTALEAVNYLAIFTSDSSSVRVESHESRSSHNGPHIKAFEQRFGQTFDTLYFTNWPDGAIEAIIIMIPFIFILFIGICCTFCVQSDLKYDAEKTFLRKNK